MCSVQHLRLHHGSSLPDMIVVGSMLPCFCPCFCTTKGRKSRLEAQAHPVWLEMPMDILLAPLSQVPPEVWLKHF